MTKTKPQTKTISAPPNDAHQKAQKKVLSHLPANASSAQKKLTEALCFDIPAEDLELVADSFALEMTTAQWMLAKKHKPGETQIKIQKPKTKSIKNQKTLINIVSNDMAFLVDSVAAEINRHNLLIDILVHPLIYCSYNDKGQLTATSPKPKKNFIRQSHIHVQVKDILSSEDIRMLEDGLRVVMEDVTKANQDWPKMLERLKNSGTELANSKTRRPADEITEYSAFLDYLHDNNFTLLGYRQYEFIEQKGITKSRTVKNSSLGLLHNGVRPAYISETDNGLSGQLQKKRRNLPPISISKTNRLSTVHRSVPMDAIAIKIYDDKGNITGEHLFIGLFTSVTYSRSVSDIPYLRWKVEKTVDMSDFLQGSHDRKALRHILEKYPRDELFQIKIEALYKTSLSILRLQERQRIALYTRVDPFGRYISCLVYIPRDRFGTKLRMDICDVLEKELGGTCSNFTVSLDDSVYARVMFTINVSQKIPLEFKRSVVEKKIQVVGQTWQERLSTALDNALNDNEAIHNLTLRYGDAFPVEYTTRYKANQAVFDIKKIEEAYNTNELKLDLYRPEDVESNQLRLKVYHPGAPLTLSDVMPILENMGLRAISELPYAVIPSDIDQPLWIHDFLLEMPRVDNFINVKEVKANFEKAFSKIWSNNLESDSLNKLVLSANVNWHEIMILRSYVRYMVQIRYPFSRPYIEKALTQHPEISRQLVDLFRGLHNPANGKNAESLAAGCAIAIDHELEKVTSLDEDRILRTVTSLVESTLRTNYFQRNEDGSAKSYLSIKLDCSKIKELPAPKPFREIFVYSPRVEGIHLRGDKIARGGLRWSDRHEDYRTEVLGLMKAQMVKNSVIVPMGAKGGFVVKTQTKTRDEFMSEGIACYKTFISGLLDIADNLKGKRVIPPKSVTRRDGDDPYLVVAADKGTATFSDIANGISQDYGFWLDDAFASGGSAGYDHKKMGITARGAWESVKLHFRQLNHDTQNAPFDVVGVGDMGGDVFGNGMLLSKHIRLIGAFNHLHIVCDPDPDPAKTYKERKRLFNGVKGWDAYNTKLLSKGGRIFSRSDKILDLTPEIQARFDIEKSKVTPNELMRAILKSRTDLLWFGGIGTYIKSTKETHADAGDKSSDALRIDAPEIRAKVIGEGANLGVTQLGRIEFCEKGGKMNTDFVDNSGGVDSSDHEVNIKILLTDVMNAKNSKMNTKSRNKLLESMTSDIADHVLRNNYQQAQAISLAEFQAKETLQIQDEFIQDLERERGLDRELEGLPDTETVELRLRTGKGLTRPELCVLLSYAKISLAHDLLECSIPDTEEIKHEWLINYFPKALQKKYEKEILNHKLSREIIATTMSNSMVNRMGPTFLKSRMSKTGASLADVVRAYIIVRDAFGLRKLWDSIEALDNKVPAEVQLRAMKEIANLAEHAMTWFLTRLGRDLDLSADIKNFHKGIADLRGKLDTLVTDELKVSIKMRAEEGVRDGLPKALARDIALIPVLSSACDIIRMAEKSKGNLMNTARTYFELGERFHLDWLRQQARYLSADDHWQAEAKSGLVDQLFSCQAGLTVRILNDTAGRSSNGGSLAQKWFEKHAHQIDQLDPLFAQLRRAGSVDLPMLVIAEQRLRQLYGG